jgi:glycosyltransferase involved in cell wall biosynthesis
VVLAEWPEMALYGTKAPPQTVRVLDMIELRSVTYGRYARSAVDLNAKLFWRSEQHKMQRLESFIRRNYDVVTAVSSSDGSMMEALRGRARVVVNPVGLELDRWPREDVLPRWQNTLVFLGRMSYGPNQDAVRYFIQHIYPTIHTAIPDVRFFIVGGDPPEDILAFNGQMGVTVTGYVPDVNEYLQRGTVFVLPMRQGGGIKIKALSAMVAGIPVVSTPEGVEGVDGKPDKGMLVAKNSREFGDLVAQLLLNRTLRDHIATAARDLVRSRYDVRINVQKLEEIYLEQVRVKRQRSFSK